MRTKTISYPFIPKSTAYMMPGQYWSIPLKNGRYACGRVLEMMPAEGYGARRAFLGGVLDWVGDEPPTTESIAGARLLDQGDMHICAIYRNSGIILGHRPLELDGLEPGLFMDQSPGRNCRLMHGYKVLGFATPEQQATLPVFSTWGFAVAIVVAEHYFG